MSKPQEPGQMSRDDLESEVSELRGRVERLESMFEIRGAENVEAADIEHIWLCGVPVGKMIQGAKTRSHKNKKRLEQDTGGANTGVSNAARSEMIEVHRQLVDWHEGAASDLDGSKLRAVVYFRQFVRNLDDNRTMTGIESDYGKFKLKSDCARHILEDEDLLPDTNASMAKKRAMKKLVRMSTVEDCNCSALNCEHALFHFKNEQQYVLSVDQDDWLEYVTTVQRAIGGVDVDPNADDGGNSSEATVEDEWDEIQSDSHEESDFTKNGGSGSEEAVLVGGETDPTPE